MKENERPTPSTPVSRLAQQRPLIDIAVTRAIEESAKNNLVVGQTRYNVDGLGFEKRKGK